MCSDRRKNHGCEQKKPEGTSSAIFGVGTAAKCCKLRLASEHNKAEVLEVKFRNLNFSPSTKTTTECSFELFLSIYRYDCFFFLKFKLRHCRTVVLLNKLKLCNKPPFKKRRWSCDFLPRKLRWLPKSAARFPAKKRWHWPPPVGLPWDSPPSPPESVCTEERTLTS